MICTVTSPRSSQNRGHHIRSIRRSARYVPFGTPQANVSVVAGLGALAWAAVRVCQRAVRRNLRYSQQNEMFYADHLVKAHVQASAPSRRYGHLLREGICCAASFKVENSFVGTSHWLLTRAALWPWRGCSLVSRWR